MDKGRSGFQISKTKSASKISRTAKPRKNQNVEHAVDQTTHKNNSDTRTTAVRFAISKVI